MLVASREPTHYFRNQETRGKNKTFTFVASMSAFRITTELLKKDLCPYKQFS